MTKIKFYFILFSIVLLTSCQYANLLDHLPLKKDITTLKEFRDLGLSGIKENKEINDSLIKQNICVLYRQLLFNTLRCELYVYVFKDDKLVYWGQNYKFLHHKDPVLRKIGEEMIPIAKKMIDRGYYFMI